MQEESRQERDRDGHLTKKRAMPFNLRPKLKLAPWTLKPTTSSLYEP